MSLAALLILGLPLLSPAQTPDTPSNGSIQGKVMDADGGVLPAATVTLVNGQDNQERVFQTDAEGSYGFADVPEGNYRLTVAVASFDSFTNPDIELKAGQSLELPPVMMKVTMLSTNVDVSASTHDVAEAQMKSETQQRILGILPNYYTVYYQNPAPLTAKQKIRLAFRSSIDPFNFGAAAAQAAIETPSNDFSAYGTGAAGFAKRYGAAYADGFSGTMIGSGFFPALLRQDPRYYYKGTGSVASRVGYALSWIVLCKGDNGKWQPNYSFLLGDIASAGVSDLYYPPALRNSGWQTVKYSLYNLASQGVNALMQEFLLKHLTTHAKDPGK